MTYGLNPWASSPPEMMSLGSQALKYAGCNRDSGPRPRMYQGLPLVESWSHGVQLRNLGRRGSTVAEQ